MVRTKVFVGNLAFSTKEAELAKHFEQAGKVISANIITRGPRSLGYGFVEMESEQDAENAVKQLDKKEIDGRPINVEVAKPREENATNPAQGQDQSQRNNQQGGNGSANGNNGTRPPRNNRRPRQRRNQGQQGGNQVQGQQGNQVQGQQANQNNQGLRNNQGQGQQGGNKQATSGQQQTGQPRQPRTRQPRQRPEGEDTRTPSTTTLFVANLPYALDNDAFGKVLKDGSLAFKSATVSTKKKSGLSKGFGFIEFDSEVDQQKALAALQGKKITEREIVVKVALTGGRDDATKAAATTGTTADVVTPTNKPSEIKANVVAATKQAEKPTTPKQDKK